MTDLRKCIGSAKFGIERHEAPPGDFPVQPSQKDGLGRMCKPHWNQYTAALARDREARKAADADPVVVSAGAAIAEQEPGRATPAPTPKPIGTGRRKPEPNAVKVRKAKAVVAATEALTGKAHTDAVGSDEVQAALEFVAKAHAILD